MKVKRVIKSIVFILILVMMVNVISTVLTPTYIEGRWESASSVNSFYEEEEDSIEVVFAGPSVMAAAIDPYQMYLEHGISAYNIAMISEPLLGTYFWIKECFETQSPKLVVVDPQTCARTSVKIEEKFRRCYDYMKWGKNKIDFALAYNKTDEEIKIWDYLFPLSKFHTRWSQLTEEDMDFMKGNNMSVTRGYNAMTRRSEIEYNGVEDTSEELPDVYNTLDCEYLEKIIDYCKEQNTPILLLRTPDSRWNIKKHNLIEKIAKEKEVPFVDFNMSDIYAELDMDFAVDAKDENHLGVYGAEKFTKYLGQYLKDNYELTDFRGTEIGEDIEEGLDDYNRYISNAKMEDSFNLAKIIEYTEGKNYDVLISVSKEAKFTEEAKEILSQYGVDEEFLDDNSNEYNKMGLLSIGKDGTTFTWKKEKVDVATNFEGITGNNKEISVTMDEDGNVNMKAGSFKDDYKAGTNVIVYDNYFEKMAATFHAG